MALELETKEDYDGVYIKDVPIGDIFWFEEELYLRVNDFNKGISTKIIAISLDGKLYILSDLALNTEVKPLKESTFKYKL